MKIKSNKLIPTLIICNKKKIFYHLKSIKNKLPQITKLQM